MTITSDLSGTPSVSGRRYLDAGDLAELYAAHRLKLVRLAILLVDDQASAEDVVQDAFASLAGRLHKIREPHTALGYLRTSVVNGSRSALRRRRTARGYVPPAEAEPPGPDDRAVLAEEHREVLAGLDRLAPRQREVVVLRYWSGLSEAEIADACDLTPATPPAVVPLHRRRPVVAAAVTAGLVAAAAVVAVAVGGDDPTVRGDEQVATPSPSPSSSAVPITGADGIFDETDPGYVDPGTTVTDEEGWTAVVSDDSTTLTVTDDSGTSYAADLDVAEDGSSNQLSSVVLPLGQAGAGWLVRGGAEETDLTLLTLRSGELVAASEPDSPPFGDGQDHRTWLNGSVLRTRVSVGTPDEQQYDVYSWEVTGPGEGGGEPDSDVVELLPTRDGTYCVDDGVATACPADPFAEVEDGPALPAQDDGDTVGPGERVTYPGPDGWTAELVPSGDGFALLVDEETVPLQIDVPGAVEPSLDTTLLRYGTGTGWLIRDELGGGDSTRYTVVSFAGGDLVLDEYDGTVPFGSGVITDSGLTGRYETFTAGGGKGLYTRVYPDMEKNDSLVYSWTLDSESSRFRPTLLGAYCLDRETRQEC